MRVDAAKAHRALRNGFITLVLAGGLVVGLLLAVPGLKGVATTASDMAAPWVLVAVVTLIVAGLGLCLGLSGPRSPLLSVVPAAAGVLALVLFLLLPLQADRIVRRVR